MTKDQIEVARGAVCEWLGWRRDIQGYWVDCDGHYAVNKFGLNVLPSLTLDWLHECVQGLRYPHTQSLWRVYQIKLEEIVSRRVSESSVSFRFECQNATKEERLEALYLVKEHSTSYALYDYILTDENRPTTDRFKYDIEASDKAIDEATRKG